MLARVLATFVSLTFLIISVSAQAAPLFPLQTGNWLEMDKQDNSGHKWTVRMMVFEETTMDNAKQYFRIQELYYDPYGVNGGDTFSEFYMRSTDTELFFYNGLGAGETLAFRTGQAGDSWEYPDGSGTIHKEIVATDDQIIIPYGGTYSAYKYKHYNINDPSRYDLEWVVPGLGLVKEEDHWLDSSQASRIPLNSVLARAGTNPFFFPLKTGMRLIYNASDNAQPDPHTWQMTIQVLEQVTLNDGLYFHMRQTNYDPIGGDFNSEFYARCDASQVFARKFNDNSAHLEYQAAAPGTSWSFTRPSHPPVYKRISSIQSVDVLGRSIPTYVTDQSPDTNFLPPNLMTEFIAPGLGPVEMLDWWNIEPTRAPLQFLLARVSQGGSSPAVSLLLLD